jgi:hypothetical protein
MKRLLLTVLSLTIFAACGPSPEARAMQTAAAWTATPTVTATVTSSPTPTLTPTPIPTPTPVPTATPLGGSGRLVFTWYKRGYSGRFNVKGVANVFVADWDGGNLQPVTAGLLGFNIAAGVSPDGRQVLVRSCAAEPRDASTDNCHLYVVALEGGAAQRLDGNVTQAADAAWLPNGRIVYIGDDRLYTINADGSALTAVDWTPKHGRFPVNITGAGGRLFYFADAARCSFPCFYKGPVNTWWVLADGSGPANPLPAISGDPNDVAYSPDAQRVAWMGRGSMYVAPVTATDTALTVLESQAVALPIKCEWSFNWSPDSARLWIQACPAEANSMATTFHIWSAADSKLVDVPPLGENINLAAVWSPDGRQVLLSQPWNYTSKVLNLTTLQVSNAFECTVNKDCVSKPEGGSYRWNPLWSYVSWVPAPQMP